MYSETRGEVGKDGNTLVVRRIIVTYHLKIDPTLRDVAERVLGFHADYCPVYRTIHNCVDITTLLEMTDIDE